MTITTLSQQEFSRDPARARQAAESGPVFITERGRPAFVLLSVAEYERLSGCATSIIDLLGMPGIEEVEFDAPRSHNHIHASELG
jgi:hypothetical protein